MPLYGLVGEHLAAVLREERREACPNTVLPHCRIGATPVGFRELAGVRDIAPRTQSRVSTLLLLLPGFRPRQTADPWFLLNDGGGAVLQLGADGRVFLPR